jgi:probable HAF family extracellular repeat protein
MAWIHRRTTTVRRRAAVTVAAVATAIVVAVVATSPSPVAAQAGDEADEIPASRSAVPAFLLRSDRFTAFQPPDPDVAIYPSGINDRGEVTGEYIRSDGESGFVRRRNGRISTFRVPGARGTEASKINDRGQIVGRYSEDTPLVDDSSRVRGYMRHRGRTTRIDFPRARHTHPTGINDRGHVVGYYVDRRGATHGFLWRNRRFTTLDLVGARSPTPVDINDRGEIVGMYLDRSGAGHGFMLADGRYTTISAPGDTATMPTGINDRGQVVGYTADDELNGARGFRRAPGATASYTPVNVPDAPRTLPLGTNDRGDVVGLNESPDDSTTWPDNAEEMTAMAPGIGLATVRGITVNTEIADRLDALLAAAEAAGLDFTGGGYRDPQQQIELRRQNCGTSYYAIYERPSSECSPPTARPGTSNHERGLAIDFNCDGSLIRSRSSECFQWLADNAADYGFYNLPSEPWHWSVDGS